MKVATFRDAFLPVLTKVMKVVPNSKSVPVLNYIKVDVAEDHSVQLTATDLATSLTVKAGMAKGDTAGSFLVPAQLFHSCVHSSQAKAVLFSHEDNKLAVHSGNTKWVWPTLDVDQFPKIAALSESVVHTLSRDDLLTTFRLVKSAASVGSVRANLEQIGIRQGYVQAADGVRFHEVMLPGSDLVDVAFPLPFVTDLQSVLSNLSEETVELGVPEAKDALIVRCGDYTLMSKVKAESFPDVSHAFKIPALVNEASLKADRKALVGAVSRVGVASDPSTRAVRLTVSGDALGNSTLRVSAKQRNGSQASEDLSVSWSGGERSATFNSDYLLNLLSLFDTDYVELRFGADQKHKPSTVLIQVGARTGVLNQLQVDWA